LLSLKEFSSENIQWNYSNDLFRSDLEKNNFEELNVLNELGQTIAIHWIDNKSFQLKNAENKGLVIIHYVYQGKTYVERISLR
jgi:predicted RNA methylase